MPRKRIPRDVTKARQLRATMTLPEVLLWRLLKCEPDGVKFRRKHQVDKYFLDFYCPKANVGIEVDGIVHDMGDNPERDELRDAKIKESGIEVMRVPAKEVLHSPEDVAEGIVRFCKR